MSEMVGQPRIIAAATANPPWRFTQEQVLALSPYRDTRIREIFLNSDIEARYLWIDPERFTPDETVDQLHQRYREGALQIACQAAQRCLTGASLTPQDVDLILVCSCTGYLCPDLGTILVKHMGLRRDVERGAMLGLGCAGAMPTLQRAFDHAAAHPGRRVLMIAVEICSACYFLDQSMETVIGNAICADGAAACLVTTDGGRGPRIRGFRTLLDPDEMDKVGFEQRGGRLRIILASSIRKLAGPMVRRAVAELLEAHGLTPADIRFWILHPGGRKVVERVQTEMGLDDEQIAFSRHVLRNYGNMSSPTVLFVLQQILERGNPQPGDHGVMLALGPGLAAEAALLEF